MNPCRCGHAGEPGFSCRLGANCRDKYMARISGPILDRIDIRINVPPVTAVDMTQPPASEGSHEIRERVDAARARQRRRYEVLEKDRALIRTNADCPPALLEHVAAPDAAGMKLFQEAATAFGLSARGYHRALRLARTLADLDGDDNVRSVHVAEAFALRGAEPGSMVQVPQGQNEALAAQ
jgi:magnesium chelatase family protein